MSDPVTEAAILLLAAGSGTRVGAGRPKQLLHLAGRSLVHHAATTYRGAAVVVVVYHPDHRDEIVDAARDALGSTEVRSVPGGTDRRTSIANGVDELMRIGWLDEAIVVLQNAASPDTPRELASQVVAAATLDGAAQAVVPSQHTLVELDDGHIRHVVPHGTLFHTVDPTAYRFDVLRDSLVDTDGGERTLDLVRRAGVTVTAVPSPASNLKVTTSEDLLAVTRRSNSLPG